MSIVRSLMWLFDRTAHREEEAKQKRMMMPERTRDPDEGPPPPEILVKERALPRRCRVCGRMEETLRYCPDCLSETLTADV